MKDQITGLLFNAIIHVSINYNHRNRQNYFFMKISIMKFMQVLENEKEMISMLIKVLGTGCANCKRVERNVQAAIADLGVKATIEKITDLKEISQYGIMSTPALVVNEEVKTAGKVPSIEDIKGYLTTA